MVEFITMVVFDGLDTLSPIQFAVLDASILSLTLLVGMFFWFIPHLMREQEATLDQGQLLQSLTDAMHMGGDEFAAILEGNVSLESTALVAKKLLAAMYEAKNLGKNRYVMASDMSSGLPILENVAETV